MNLSPEVHGRAQTQRGDQPSSNQMGFSLLHGVPKLHCRSKIKGVDSEVTFVPLYFKEPKVFVHSPAAIFCSCFVHFLTCAVVNMLQKKIKYFQDNESFRHRMAPQTCHIMLTTRQMPLSTRTA